MPTIDELGTRAAARLTDELRSSIDVDARLAAFHESGESMTPARRTVPPRVWGAAASVVIIAIGAMGFVALRRHDPAVSPTPSTTVTTVPSPSTTAPIDTVPESSLTPIAVRHDAPPPLFQPTVFATVSPDAQVGVSETGVVVATPGGVETIDWDGTPGASTSLPWTLLDPVAYEGVVYGLAQTSAATTMVMVAAALSPSPAGVLSTTPVSAVRYVELPIAPFGLGRDGVVDRVRDVGATLVPYAAYGGSPRTFDGAVSAAIDDSLLVTSSGGQRWQLDIERDPAAVGDPPRPLAGPLPGADGSVVFSTFLGPSVLGPGGSLPSQYVIAELDADGGGRWWSLPEGWTLAASDVFGTVLQRETDTGLELARFPHDETITPPTSDPSITEVDVEPQVFPLDIEGCDPAKEQYCSVDSLADGTLIVHRQSTASLVTLEANGVQRERRIEPAISGWMIGVGPDDVVYLETTEGGEERGDIVALRLGDTSATEITRVRSVGDPSGDTDIVATRAGLVTVSCCGGSAIRPDPTREPVMRWVDQSGRTITDDRAFIRVEGANDGGIVFVREEPDGTTTRWPSTGSIQTAIRGMPGVAALPDGGAMVAYQDMASPSLGVTLLRLKPSGAIERTLAESVYAFPTQSGRLIGSGPAGPTEVRLATFADPQEIHVERLPTGPSADAVIDALLEQLRPGPECDFSSIALRSRVGTDPVTVTIARREGCDDSGIGENLVFDITAEAGGRWVVVRATSSTLCLRGVSDDGASCV